MIILFTIKKNNFNNKKNKLLNIEKTFVQKKNFNSTLNMLSTKGEIFDKSETNEKLDEGYVRVPDLRGKSMRKVIYILNNLNLKPKIQGSGIVFWQFPKPGQIVKQGIVCKVGLK